MKDSLENVESHYAIAHTHYEGERKTDQSRDIQRQYEIQRTSSPGDPGDPHSHNLNNSVTGAAHGQTAAPFILVDGLSLYNGGMSH